MKTNDLESLPKDLNVHLKSRYAGKPKFLLHHIDLLEKTMEPGAVIIFSNDLKRLWSDFKNLYHLISASGGLVYNPDGEVLAIYRMGFWDLPKGKIEKGEKKKKAAVREVMEETGLRQVQLEHKLITTYHTYRDPRKDRRVLKKTFWYRMSTLDQDLIPQKEEDIEQAIWIKPNNFKEQRPIYNNILDVLAS